MLYFFFYFFLVSVITSTIPEACGRELLWRREIYFFTNKLNQPPSLNHCWAATKDWTSLTLLHNRNMLVTALDWFIGALISVLFNITCFFYKPYQVEFLFYFIPGLYCLSFACSIDQKLKKYIFLLKKIKNNRIW